MDKQKWYFENSQTGEITDIRECADWWSDGGVDVNCWRWSEYSQEWEILMVQEGR